ncbi:ABC transporter permease [Ancylobacter pratisalsi]|uniref:ABC transporter permease n=1 Tax=Ancylobacter pratisalsi TaxID=1745854 RepID=A0A6P1YHE1_9HYPH|nr:ABC transporter permease [Ancylobacter pratisalsi]QIB32562.1 ABC transporter permease [Ancylobacter pratisalsi]
MIRFVPRERTPLWLTVAVSIGSGLAALLLTAVPLALSGAPILDAFLLMAKGAAGDGFALAETLTRATPLIFTGLAAAVAFRAKLWNIGAEGQLYAGALATVALGAGLIEAPSYVLLPLVLLAAALAGAALLLVAVFFKSRFGADEVVVTLLMNFIVLLIVQMMLEGPMKDEMALGWPQSAPVLDEATLPKLITGLRLHWGLIIAIAAALLLHVLMSRTVWGFRIRAVGENARAARYAGLPVGRSMVLVGLLSGGLAGLAGASEVAGLKGYLTSDLSPGFGYAGIVVATLANLSPLGVIPSAIFIAGVFVGADSMSRTIGVSNYLADLVVSFSLLSVLIGGLLTRFRLVMVRREAA